MTAEGQAILGIVVMVIAYALIIAIAGFMSMWHRVGSKLARNGCDEALEDRERGLNEREGGRR